MRPPASPVLPPRKVGRPQPPLPGPRAAPGHVSASGSPSARDRQKRGLRQSRKTTYSWRNLLTGRAEEERSERSKGQGPEDVPAAGRSCRGGCQSRPEPPRSGGSLTRLLSSPTVCEQQRTTGGGGADSRHHLSLGSTHPGQTLWLTGPGEEGQRSKAFLSLSVCSPIYLSVNELSSENIDMVFVFV